MTGEPLWNEENEGEDNKGLAFGVGRAGPSATYLAYTEKILSFAITFIDIWSEEF